MNWDIKINDEIDLLRETVRQFAEKNISPIPDKIAANKKNGHNLILSAIVPETIETVVTQNTIWKYQSDPSA